MTDPRPGPSGNHAASCVTCARGTDMGVAFSGQPELVEAALQNHLGIERETATYMVRLHQGADESGVPLPGEPIVTVRLCGACAGTAGLQVGVLPCAPIVRLYRSDNTTGSMDTTSGHGGRLSRESPAWLKALFKVGFLVWILLLLGTLVQGDWIGLLVVLVVIPVAAMMLMMALSFLAGVIRERLNNKKVLSHDEASDKRT